MAQAVMVMMMHDDDNVIFRYYHSSCNHYHNRLYPYYRQPLVEGSMINTSAQRDLCKALNHYY